MVFFVCCLTNSACFGNWTDFFLLITGLLSMMAIRYHRIIRPKSVWGIRAMSSIRCDPFFNFFCSILPMQWVPFIYWTFKCIAFTFSLMTILVFFFSFPFRSIWDSVNHLKLSTKFKFVQNVIDTFLFSPFFFFLFFRFSVIMTYATRNLLPNGWLI